MILTCPRCATSFLVDDEEIGEAGRRVRCSACSHEWRAFPGGAGEEREPAADEPSVDEPSVDEPSGAAGWDAVPAAASPPVDAPPLPALDPAPFVAPEPPAEPATAHPEPVVAAPVEEQPLFPRAPRPRPRQRPSPAPAVAIIVALVLVALLVAAWALRADIMRAFPASRGVYAAFGLAQTSTRSAPPHG